MDTKAEWRFITGILHFGLLKVSRLLDPMFFVALLFLVIAAGLVLDYTYLPLTLMGKL
jgi:hypothetical protein